MRLRSCLLSAGFLALSISPLTAGPVTGNWMTHQSKAMVNISQCGPSLCGKIVWLSQPTDSAGKPVRDVRNRNPALRDRAVMGMRTFSGLSPDGPNKWSGTMYNPDDGRTYNGSITLTKSGRLYVRGCRVGTGTCGARKWTRAQRQASN